MKTLLLGIGLLIAVLSTSGQNAKEILKKSYNKCQSIQNGKFEMMLYSQHPGAIDTFPVIFKGAFSKLKNDNLYPSAFHYTIFWKGATTGSVLYTGNEFVRIQPSDSTAEIMSKELWAGTIATLPCMAYAPFVSKQSVPLPQGSDFTDMNTSFRYLGEEKINNVPCHHIQMTKIPVNDSKATAKTLRYECQYWIRKVDFVPIQYSTAQNELIDRDTTNYYQKFVLNKYEINNLKDNKFLTLKSIPSNYTVKEYAPEKLPDLLAKGTDAPNWELLSLTDEHLKLEDLKGQVVMLDFFYKNCYTCTLALPTLQSLHEKYKAKGLRIIGIDIYDKKEDNVASFLSKHGVSYTVLFGNAGVAEEYHVAAYPTIYLIDKTGKIIFSQISNGKELEQKLDELFSKAL